MTYADRAIRTPPGYSGLTSLIATYEFGARARSLVWELTREQVAELTVQNCVYCGIIPKQISYGSLGKRKEHGQYVYNGIDRVDSSIGYVLANCVPCCRECNLAKRDRNVNEFLAWAKRIAQHNQ